MKKLLSLIGAITIISTSATSLVSCSSSSNRFDKPTIQDIVKKTIIAEIEQGITGQDKKLNYSFNQIFTQADLTTLAVKLLDTAIANYFYNKEETQRSSWVNETSAKPPTDQKSLNNFIETIAKNNLYTEYMTGFATNNALEIQVSNKGYSVGYQAKEWYIPGVVTPLVSKTSGTAMTVADLSNNLATLAKDTTTYTINYKDDGSSNKPEYSVFLQASLAEKKNMLAARFQDYYLHYEVSNVISNILTSSYIHKDEFVLNKLKDGTEININTGNPLFSNMQTSWSLKTGDSWYSNLKLVWELKLDKSQFSDVFTKLYDAYQTLPNHDPNANPTNILYYFNQLLNPINQSTDTETDHEIGKQAYEAFLTVIKEFNRHSVIPNSETTSINQINSGQDPVFGMDGFKGLVGINKGKIFTTNNLDSSYSDLITNNKISRSFGFLASNAVGQTTDSFMFNNSTNSPSIVMLLPIYAVDLIKNMKMSYKLDGAEPKIKDISLNTYNAAGVSTNLSTIWNNQQTILSIPNKVSMLNSMTGIIGNGNETDSILSDDYDTNNIKSNLLSLIEYTFAQQADIQNFAKQSFYSIAFNYNSNNVYSNQLYNQIGKYIINEN